MTEAEDPLLGLRQGGWRLEWYVEEFLELANQLNWHDAALGACFQLGLDNETIRCDLPVCEYPLIELINLVLYLNGSNFEVEEIREDYLFNKGSRVMPAHSSPGTPTCRTNGLPAQPQAPVSSAPNRRPTQELRLQPTQALNTEPSFTPEIPAEYTAFQDVFSKQAATHLPPHRPWDCAIELLPGAQLPKGRIYPSSIPGCQAMENYIAEALSQGSIQPSTSPAASSFFCVGKKDGGLRPCTDYRQLNSQIIQRPYPLPLVPAALEELCGARVFTKLNLRSAYLVRIRAGDEWKTAFYRVMPYSLSISPSVFQTFMNEVFREFLHQFVVVYIDDILIYSRNLAEHRQHVQQVLHKLCEYGLYLKLESSTNHPWIRGKSPPYRNGLNLTQRFIKNYSSITAPLTSLLRGKPKNLTWNPAAHEAFQRLKNIFSTAPLLHHPDPELPFTVEVDASISGVGAVLSQAVGEPPLLHPCAFYLRELSPAEQNYDVGNQELLAIKLALEEWRHWLKGAAHQFTIVTDHKNLQYLQKARRLNPRQARWAPFSTRFDFKISSDCPSEPKPIIPSNLIISPILWDQDVNIQQATLQEPAPPECPEGKIYVPRSQCQPLLGAAHQQQMDPVAPSNSLLVTQYIQSCSVCAMSTSPPQLPTGKLVPLPIPQRPWSHIEVDFVTDLPNSEEHLFQQVFHHFGLPEEIVSDWGPQFISHLLGVSANLSSGYHPQTNGQTERKIQELGRYLRAYCHKDQHSWSRFLLWAEYVQNSLRQDTTGLTPFQCVLGYQPPLFPWTEEPSNVPAVDHWFRESVGLASSPSPAGSS
ncbi:hypothetical protein M9458_008593, partial [Cirrhinus mrigala]